MIPENKSTEAVSTRIPTTNCSKTSAALSLIAQQRFTVRTVKAIHEAHLELNGIMMHSHWSSQMSAVLPSLSKKWGSQERDTSRRRYSVFSGEAIVESGRKNASIAFHACKHAGLPFYGWDNRIKAHAPRCLTCISYIEIKSRCRHLRNSVYCLHSIRTFSYLHYHSVTNINC